MYVAIDKWQRHYRVRAESLQQAQDLASEALGPHGYLQVVVMDPAPAYPYLDVG